MIVKLSLTKFPCNKCLESMSTPEISCRSTDLLGMSTEGKLSWKIMKPRNLGSIPRFFLKKGAYGLDYVMLCHHHGSD